MKTLAVDIGTGTQDIFLFNSRLAVENGFRLVLPSPTMMIHDRIREATRRQSPIVLTGTQMGGGPAAWAAQSHAQAGLPVFATPGAALTLDDDLDRAASMGVQLVSDDEVLRLGTEVERITLGDLDFAAINEVFLRFGIQLGNLDALAVAVFDHGAAPPEVSDRQFRFDYLDRRIRQQNSLSAFAYRAEDVPPIMSRLQSVARCASSLAFPVVLMDTAPAAILGATFDPVVRARRRVMIVNIGNFHSLAFRLASSTIEALCEHHTGELNLPKLESLLISLADGSLRHEDVFNDMGHGALIYAADPLPLGSGDFDVVVTGPRRGLYRVPPAAATPDPARQPTRLRPYFAVPFGDMMLSGCFGLLSATAEVLPELGGPIREAMEVGEARGVAPWDLG